MQNQGIIFRSQVKIIGVNPYVLVSSEKVAQLKRDWRRPMPVYFQINKSERSWQVNLMPVGDGSFRLYLSGDIRKASGLKVGDSLDIAIRFDRKYKNGPQHSMPPWFDIALSQNSLARHGWLMLTPSGKKEILRYFARIKSSEARDRNLHQVLHVLAGGDGRFLGRAWNEDRRVD